MWHFEHIMLLRECKNRCNIGIAIFLFQKNLDSLIIYITFALGNKCKIYEVT
jgi:hypothetical protein